MANLTVAIDDDTLRRARVRALERGGPSTRSSGRTWSASPTTASVPSVGADGSLWIAPVIYAVLRALPYRSEHVVRKHHDGRARC